MLTQQAIQLATPGSQLQSSVAILLFLYKEGDNAPAPAKTAVWPCYTEAGEWLTEWLAVCA